MDQIFTKKLKSKAVEALKSIYQAEVDPESLIINPTRKEIEGDFTLVVFPFTKIARKGPEQLGKELGEWLQNEMEDVASYNVVKGFLNFELSAAYWFRFLEELTKDLNYGKAATNGRKVVVEYSSPNTNKPLHLGHVRNNLLGWSMACILKAAGYEVSKVQIINDRGIHICKSMIAWKLFGNGETPESAGMKGDHLIGKYYVRYATEEKKQKQVLEEAGKSDVEPEILRQARAMLLKWENGDPEVMALWKKMNEWVYSGFEITYRNLGVSFDKYYYESQTYLLGKDLIVQGLESGLFYEKEDGSVWIDLEDAGLDHKLVRRSDGTSVYMTQDLGTARQRYHDFKADSMVYVVGDEQDYHFKVLFEILKRMGEPYSDGLYHLSYGLVNLPSGRMKSREGTVVDADDLMEEVISEAENQSEERATLEGVEEKERKEIWRMIGLAALKYHILKVNPRKSMVYNPEESLELQGQTGPYIQNAFVRIQGVQRNHTEKLENNSHFAHEISQEEKELLLLLHTLPETVLSAAKNYDPSELAHYAYDLAKGYHRFYHDHRILSAETEAAKSFRLDLSKGVGVALEFTMNLLGIELPDRM